MDDQYLNLRYKFPGSRTCCVLGCQNSGQKLTSWLKSQCSVHNSTRDLYTCDCKPPFLLFPFPSEKKDPDSMKTWTKLVNRMSTSKRGKIWEPNCDSRICSQHFLEEEPTTSNPYPSLNLGYSLSRQICVRKEPKCRSDLPAKRRKPNPPEEITAVSVTECSESVSELSVLETASISDASSINSAPNDHDYWQAPEDTTEDMSCEGCNYLSEKVRALKNTIKKLERELRAAQTKLVVKEKKPFNMKQLRTDKAIKLYTGIPSVSAFDALFEEIKTSVPKLNYWRGPSLPSTGHLRRKFFTTPKKFGPQRSLTSREEMVITLMKLKLGLTNDDLAFRFGISSSSVSRILTTWIKFLSTALSSLIYLPEKDAISSLMPLSFKRSGLGNVHHIIDCTEVFIEKPKDPKAACQTWSDYKHHNTLKFLVDILPNGQFTFVSNTYGGRASDKFVTVDSGFLGTVERDTEVMADKGFSSIHEELAFVHASLRVPPGRRGGNQLTKVKGEKTKLIANKRILVEQAIRRLKTFRLLKFEIPISFTSLIDDAIIICAAICNMYPPLSK